MMRASSPCPFSGSGIGVDVPHFSFMRAYAVLVAMTAPLSKSHMTVDEFLTWAENQPGRYELYDGVVYAMTPERAVHAKIKFSVQVALANAIRARGLPCHMLPDGMTVRAAKDIAYEPDALVYCGAELPPSAIEVPNPVIVVEVLSRSTQNLDTGRSYRDISPYRVCGIIWSSIRTSR
jgi:Uma2 family endonuclease